MYDDAIKNELVEQLRGIARTIERHKLTMTFPSLYPPPGIVEPMEPIINIDEALVAMREGGKVNSKQLQQIIHYIADMMQP